MWSAMRPSWMCSVRWQLHFNSCLKSFIGTQVRARSRFSYKDPPNVDLIIGEHDFPGQDFDHETTLKEKAEKLAEILECEPAEIRKILEVHPEVLSKPLMRLVGSARALKLRFPAREILKFPSALNLSWRLLEHRRLIFEEVNAQNVDSVSALVRCDELCNLTLFELCRRQIISTVCLLPSILSKIENCPPGLEENLSETLLNMSTLALSLTQYRRIIIESYLKTWFGKTKIPSKYMSTLQKQSIMLISIRMNILLDHFQLDPDFVRRQPEFLLSSTHNLNEMVYRCSNLHNTPLSDVLKRNPSISALSVERICEVEKQLLSRKAGGVGIFRLPEAYNIDPRLYEEELPFEDTDTGSYRDPEVFKQWMHFQEIIKRFKSLAARNERRIINDPDFKLLATIKKRRDQVADFLALSLGADAKQMDALRQTLSNRCVRQAPDAVKVLKTCNHLLNEGICTKEQLCENILIAFWSIESIKEVWEEFPKEPYEEVLGPNWNSSRYLVEMLMYEMECKGIMPCIKMIRRSAEQSEPAHKASSKVEIAHEYSQEDPGEDNHDDTSDPGKDGGTESGTNEHGRV